MKQNLNYESNSFRRYTRKSETDKALNKLLGIIEGILADDVVNDHEINELSLWLKHHQDIVGIYPFKDISHALEQFMLNDPNSSEDLMDVYWLCQKFSEEHVYYDGITSEIQRLQGFCHGLLADGVLSNDELTSLEVWLNTHSHLEGYYPYDDILRVTREVIKSEGHDSKASGLLISIISEFCNIQSEESKAKIDDTSIGMDVSTVFDKINFLDPVDKNFVITGKLNRRSRKEMKDFVAEIGGTVKSSVSKNTDYVIVGTDGNPCWAYACYGRKVEEAIHLRKDGAPVKIISEELFEDMINA